MSASISELKYLSVRGQTRWQCRSCKIKFANRKELNLHLEFLPKRRITTTEDKQ